MSKSCPRQIDARGSAATKTPTAIGHLTIAEIVPGFGGAQSHNVFIAWRSVLALHAGADSWAVVAELD